MQERCPPPKSGGFGSTGFEPSEDPELAEHRPGAKGVASPRPRGLCITMRLYQHRDARLGFVRTTISLDDDVAVALERLRRERGLRLSEAVNELIRAGLRRPQGRRPFKQRTLGLGLRVDVSNVAEALEQLEGPAAR